MDFHMLIHKVLDDAQKVTTRIGGTAAKAPAFTRSAALRLTKSGRRRLVLEYSALHLQICTPGLTDFMPTGMVRIRTAPATTEIATRDDERTTSDRPDAVTIGIPAHWYETEPSKPVKEPVTVIFIHGPALVGESRYR